jgi:GMP synthase (glutamine-hydrolysing)
MHATPALPLLIVKTGDTLDTLTRTLGDFEQWVAAGLGETTLPVQVLDARKPPALPAPAALAGVVLTGSHAMVSDREPWSEALVPWLQALVAHGTPVLGICYGHQLLAHALGGEVGYHPGGLELGTVDVHLTPAAQADALFSGLPTCLHGHVVHAQTVRTLPPNSVHLAANAHEPHHAFRVGRQAWGVQFHPEFNATAMQGYVEHLAPTLPAGQPQPAVRETALSNGLLARFARLCERAVALQD